MLGLDMYRIRFTVSYFDISGVRLKVQIEHTPSGYSSPSKRNKVYTLRPESVSVNPEAGGQIPSTPLTHVEGLCIALHKNCES